LSSYSIDKTSHIYVPLKVRHSSFTSFTRYIIFLFKNKFAESSLFQAIIPDSIELLECRVCVKAFADINNTIKYSLLYNIQKFIYLYIIVYIYIYWRVCVYVCI